MALIDREKLLSTIRNMVELPNEVRAQALGAVSRAKAVDAVEVVRCKDCKYGEPTVDAIGKPSCACYNINIGMYKWILEEDDFCSYGEREDNA